MALSPDPTLHVPEAPTLSNTAWVACSTPTWALVPVTSREVPSVGVFDQPELVAIGVGWELGSPAPESKSVMLVWARTLPEPLVGRLKGARPMKGPPPRIRI